MSCTTCNNNSDKDCGCIPQGLTTPTYCASDAPTCLDPSPCNETFDSKCVYYTGEGNECLGIENGQTVETVIDNISTLIEPFFCLECIQFAVPANGASNVNYNQTLTWNNVPGAVSYDVYIGTSSTELVLVSLGQLLTEYVSPTVFAPETTYYWQIVPHNAIGHVVTRQCPIYTFNTIVPACKNPVSILLKNFLDGVADFEDFSPKTISEQLASGELITNCDYCCPDCTETNRYVLASASAFSIYYNSVYTNICPPSCCIEVSSSLTALAASGINNSFNTLPPPTNCCGTGFSECVIALKEALPNTWSDLFNAYGVLEESTFSGSSTLCIIAEFLNNLPSEVTEYVKLEIVVGIIEDGLVIQCTPSGTVIASVPSYIEYMKSIKAGLQATYSDVNIGYDSCLTSFTWVVNGVTYSIPVGGITDINTLAAAMTDLSLGAVTVVDSSIVVSGNKEYAELTYIFDGIGPECIGAPPYIVTPTITGSCF